MPTFSDKSPLLTLTLGLALGGGYGGVHAQEADCRDVELFTEAALTVTQPACGRNARVCLPLPSGFSGSVWLNGRAVDLSPCATDTLVAYDVDQSSTVGLTGPYEVFWELAGTTHRGRVDSVSAILELLRRFDPDANWNTESGTTGSQWLATPQTSYGTISIVDAHTGLRREARPTLRTIVPQQAIELPTGAYTIVTQRGNCRDTLTGTLDCSPTTERSIDVIAGIQTSICLSPATDAAGYEYHAFGAEGEAARVGQVSVDGCVPITGVRVGRASATFERCALATGTCERIRLTIEVLSRGAIAPPQARRDVFALALNGQRTVDLTANDVIVGGVTDVHLSGDPRGSVRVDERHRVHYTAPAQWCGQERIGYEVCTPGGCDTSSVLFQVVCEDIYVFNGLSPNGDGINDVFTVLGLENYDYNELSIFDRSGHAIFSRRDYANDWDGTHRGHTLPAGTYYYVLEIESRETEAGYIQLKY